MITWLRFSPIAEALYLVNSAFGPHHVLEFLRADPKVAAINRDVPRAAHRVAMLF